MSLYQYAVLLDAYLGFAHLKHARHISQVRVPDVMTGTSTAVFAGGMERSIYFGPDKLKDLYHFDHFM